MMKYLLAVIMTAVAFCAPAEAARYHQQVRSFRTSLPGDCATAASLGGPCGCVAMRHVGISNRRYWLVANWLSDFPRTQPHVGAAAIWGRHHVEIVTAVHGDGTVSTTGSVGFSHVPSSRLSFVEPHGNAHAEQTFASLDRSDTNVVSRHSYRHVAVRHVAYRSRYAAYSGRRVIRQRMAQADVGEYHFYH